MVEIYSHAEVQLPGGNFTKFYWAARHAAADATMICPARRTMIWSSQQAAATFLYHFMHVPVRVPVDCSRLIVGLVRVVCLVCTQS